MQCKAGCQASLLKLCVLEVQTGGRAGLEAFDLVCPVAGENLLVEQRVQWHFLGDDVEALVVGFLARVGIGGLASLVEVLVELLALAVAQQERPWHQSVFSP